MPEPTAAMHIIAHIHTDFATKFGVPRQSGLVPALQGRIVFTPEYRVPEAVRGMEGFSHIWLIWQFSQAVREDWSPTVRPPRLGGQHADGGLRHPLPFPAQCHRPVLRPAGAGGAGYPGGAGAVRLRGRPDGRHPHF